MRPGSDASRDHLLFPQIAVELANQGVLVLGGPVGDVVNEVFDLLPAGLFEGLYPAEIDSVRLNQDRIELMLPDKLAKAVAKEVLAVSTVAADGLWGPLAVVAIVIRCERARKGSNFLHRADADAVRLTQSSIDCTSLCNSHFRPADQIGGIGWVGIAVANKALAGRGFENHRPEHPARAGWIRRSEDGPDMYPDAMASLSQLQ